MIRSFLLAGVACAALAAPAMAQTIAITNARIEPVSGPAIPSGTIVLKDGKIAALGAGIAPPAGATVIDAKGGVVTPGLIAPSSNLRRLKSAVSARPATTAPARPCRPHSTLPTASIRPRR